jgi:hypothetical protein
MIFNDGFVRRTEVMADPLPGFGEGRGKEPVTTHLRKARGQDVEKPAANEFVRMKVEHLGFAGGDVVQEEFESPLGIVAEEAFGVKGAAVDVMGEVNGGLAFCGRLEFDVVGRLAHVEVGELALLVFGDAAHGMPQGVNGCGDGPVMPRFGLAVGFEDGNDSLCFMDVESEVKSLRCV